MTLVEVGSFAVVKEVLLSGVEKGAMQLVRRFVMESINIRWHCAILHSDGGSGCNGAATETPRKTGCSSVPVLFDPSPPLLSLCRRTVVVLLVRIAGVAGTLPCGGGASWMAEGHSRSPPGWTFCASTSSSSSSPKRNSPDGGAGGLSSSSSAIPSPPPSSSFLLGILFSAKYGSIRSQPSTPSLGFSWLVRRIQA